MITDSKIETGPADIVNFDACYEVHWWPMVRLATGILGDRAAAEDAVQEAFTAVYRKWPSLRVSTRIGYLRVSVVNACRTTLRRRKTHRRHLRAVEDPPSPGADAGMAAQFERDELRAALQNLPARQREVLVLHSQRDGS